MNYRLKRTTHKAKQSALAWVLTICFLLTQIFSVSPVWGATTVPSTNASGTTRLAGGDRYETAVAVAQKGWEESEYAVVARGDAFPDALSAGPLAYAYDAPILLTAPGALNEATLNELKRLGSKKVFLVGGEAAISQKVADSISNSGMEIERIKGGSRYDTAVAVAQKLGAKSEVILATGSDFPDTLSISALAAKLGIPILLTGKDELPKSVQAYLQENAITKTYILGGAGVISTAIEQTVPHPVRIQGKDRYGTNIAVMEHFAAELDYSNVYVAQGSNFPDALAGAVLAAKKSAPLVLAGKTLSDSTNKHLSANLELDTKVIGLGGKQVVAADILAGIVNSKAQIKASEKYSSAGTYGPESGSATIAGDVIISSRDVTLRNTVIEGDLLLAASIGDGNVELNNVTVQGKTIVNGGGPNSIILIDFNGQSVIVDVPEGSNVRLVAQGSTSVGSLSMESNGQLQESNLNGAGFTTVVIPAGAQVTLSGTFDQVNIQSAGAQVNVQQGSINTMTIAPSATNAAVNLAANATVTTLNAEAAANVTGQGQITTANIKTDGVSIEQKPQNITVSEGVKDASVGGEKVDDTTPSTTPAPAAGGGGGFGGGGGDNTPSTTPVSGVSVTGDATVGQILTANPTPVNATVSYQWMRSDSLNGTYTNISGATSKTYTLTNEDLFKFIKVTVTGTSRYTGTQTSTAVQVAKVITTATELKAAVADANVKLIKLGADITLDSYLNVTRDITIDGNNHKLTRNVADPATDNESYVVMVFSGKLTAKKIEFVSNNTQTDPVANAVGITVQAGASLDLDGTRIASSSSNRSAYGVYLQDGAVAASIKNTVFDLTANTVNRNRIAIGLETSALGNPNPFSILTKSGNTIPTGAYELSFYVPAGFMGDPVELMNAALASGQTGLYWGDKVIVTVSTKDDLLTKLADPNVNLIKLGKDITLDSTLVVHRTVTIDGKGFSVNQAVNITADNVSIKNLTGTVVDRAAHQLSGVGSATAFFVNANNVAFDNIKVDGKSITPSIAVIGWKGAKFSVSNSNFANVTTGIFAHLGYTESAFQSKLTATGNTFTNVLAGIGGTQKTDLTATGNTFTSIQVGGEGIGLGSGVNVIGSTAPGVSGADVSYLESNNAFSYGEGNKVKDYRLAAVTTKAELEAALANVNTSIINISGTIGAADNYTAYEITKPVTITGQPGAEIYGSFIIKTDGVTINGLTMYTRGGGNGPLKAAIDVIAKTVTITNNIFELPNPAALATNGGVGNGVTIWPNGLASITDASYNISGNTFVGYSADTANWSSTGLQIAEGLDLARFNMGGTVSAVVDLGVAEENLAKGNIYTNCSNNYVHSNWTGGMTYKYYFASDVEQLSSLEYMGDGGTMLLASGEYKLAKQLKITKPLSIVGAGGVAITVADPFYQGTQNSDKHLISINSVRGLVELENLVIHSSTRSGINVFESDNVTLKNISSNNNTGAGLVVNNSIVVADGFNTSGNVWGYGINVDNGSRPSPSAPATKFTLNSGIVAEAKQIVSDAGNVEIVAPNYSIFIKDVSKVFGANITSWYGEGNQLLDTSVNFDFDIINVSDIDSIKFSLCNNDELLGTRLSTGANLVTLLKDCAQYWEKTADTYTKVKGKRTMSAAFSTRTEQNDNSYWISSPCTATNAYIPNRLVVEVFVDNVTYTATYSR
ncbi:MAG: cell wall-binding repeat-containing protein [Desulfitobacterium sp.]